VGSRLADAARLYARYTGISIRAQMQYKVSFWLLSLGQLLATGTEFLGIWMLFARFGSLRGWSLPEVALLYGLVNVSFALADAVGRGFDVFSNMVKSGDFDRLLLRPRSLALQVGSQELRLMVLGRLSQGIAVLVWAMHALPVAWSAAKIAFILATLAGGGALFFALLVLQATLSFWTIESLELMNILTYGSTEAGQYPLTIYRQGFRFFFTFVVPLACVNIVPARAVFAPELTPIAWLAPLAGFAFLVLALQVWRIGVRHYVSTGS
jgi:ABC-2 type transport system permease protein